jgi:hypothetical protein
MDLGHAGRLKYEIGWLFGATLAGPERTLRRRPEIEVSF